MVPPLAHARGSARDGTATVRERITRGHETSLKADGGCFRTEAASRRLQAIANLMLDVEFAELSDTGPVRDRNEDYLGCALPATPERARTHGWLFALADGVGGHDHGEVAARLAIET